MCIAGIWPWSQWMCQSPSTCHYVAHLPSTALYHLCQYKHAVCVFTAILKFLTVAWDSLYHRLILLLGIVIFRCMAEGARNVTPAPPMCLTLSIPEQFGGSLNISDMRVESSLCFQFPWCCWEPEVHLLATWALSYAHSDSAISASGEDFVEFVTGKSTEGNAQTALQEQILTETSTAFINSLKLCFGTAWI